MEDEIKIKAQYTGWCYWQYGYKLLHTNAKRKNMTNPSKKQIQDIAALYNASNVKKRAAYGKKIYKYNKWFERYNNYN